MKVLRFFLAALLALSLAAGSVSAFSPDTVSAATNKKVTVKAASDFNLKLPAGWKDSYVVEEDDSCVAFYSKKCYEEAKEGWLFSIMRFTDDSYQEIPSYQLVGKWNGVNYVVSAPKVVPLEGSSEDAVKQYKKLARSVEKVIYTIQP